MNDEERAIARAKREQLKRDHEEFEEQLAADFLHNPIGLWISEMDELLDAHLLTPAVLALRSAYQLRCLSEVDAGLLPTVAGEFAAWCRENTEAAIELCNRAMPG